MALDVNDNAAPAADDADASDWDDRRLCSDENCIGVIGPDGRCKECGRPGAPAGGPTAPVPDPPATAAPAARPPADDAPSAADGWEERRLCSDESCIGVIGPDGRCKECGKPYAG
jgi:hypothetical protein